MINLIKYIASNLLLIPGHNRGVAALASNCFKRYPFSLFLRKLSMV